MTRTSGFRSWLIFCVYNVIHFVLWSPVDGHQHCLYTYNTAAHTHANISSACSFQIWRMNSSGITRPYSYPIIFLFVCLLVWGNSTLVPIASTSLLLSPSTMKIYFTMKTGQQELLREFQGIFCHDGWQLVSGIEDDFRCISYTELDTTLRFGDGGHECPV